MNEIKKDFDPKTKPKTVVDHPKEETTSLTQSAASTKNVSQLLSELYGEADNKA